MNTAGDLDRLDRATIRIWRVSNLVGWWFVGAVAYHGIGIVLSRTFVQKVAYEFVGWQQMVAFTLVLAFAAATSGWIVGSRVHRAPGVVGALTVLFPGGLLLLLSLAIGGLVEIAIVGLYAAAPAAVSGSVARAVWRRRPRALRSTG